VQKFLPPLNITATIIDLRNLDKAESAMKSGGIKMLYLETPANPTIQCVDLEALCNMAKQHNIIVACDNTFATPFYNSRLSMVLTLLSILLRNF
jgi:methionine-gamma-lyase